MGTEKTGRILPGGVRVRGIGVGTASKVITNHDLELLVETSDSWITERTGIKERRIADVGENTTSLSIKAAEDLLRKTGTSPEEIDLILVATSTPDNLYPSTASQVQHRIGAINAGAFDLQAACSGFVYGLSVAHAFIISGAYQKVIVIGGDTHSRYIDWADRNTCVLFGDGAGAVLMEARKEKGIFGYKLHSDGSGAELLKIPFAGAKLHTKWPAETAQVGQVEMEGKKVYEFAVEAVPKVIREVLKQEKLEMDSIDWLVMHQANRRIIEACSKRLKFPMDKVIINLDRYGNTSAASIPLALAEAVEQGKIQPGHKIMTVGFGAGLTWAACLFEW